VFLLSKDFMLLILIATVITVPLIYLLFTKLLVQIQYYSVPVGVGEILISIVLLSALGLVTIFSQTLRAANANPADNLRTE
jgi:putative ABC transport system permease protein